VSKPTPAGQRRGSGGPSDAQDHGTHLYTLLLQDSTKVYSPPENLQGFLGPVMSLTAGNNPLRAL